MRPDVVVIVAPEGQRSAGVGQAVEDFVVEAFVAEGELGALVTDHASRFATNSDQGIGECQIFCV